MPDEQVNAVVREKLAESVAAVVPPETLRVCVADAVKRYLEHSTFNVDKFRPVNEAVESAIKAFLATDEAKQMLAERARTLAMNAIVNASVTISTEKRGW